MGLRKDYHHTKKRPAEYSARLVEATEIHDALIAIQRVAERSDALNALQNLAGIATEGALKYCGRMGKVAASFGGEFIASRRDANLIEQYFGSKGFNGMTRLMQAVRHGVPVDLIVGGHWMHHCRMGIIRALYRRAICCWTDSRKTLSAIVSLGYPHWLW